MSQGNGQENGHHSSIRFRVWRYIGVMAKKMETTIVYGFGLRVSGYIAIVEKQNGNNQCLLLTLTPEDPKSGTCPHLQIVFLVS